MDQMSTKHNGHDFRTTYFQFKFALLIVPGTGIFSASVTDYGTTTVPYLHQ